MVSMVTERLTYQICAEKKKITMTRYCELLKTQFLKEYHSLRFVYKHLHFRSISTSAVTVDLA